MSLKDRTGERHGRLVLVRCVGRDRHQNAIWLARCDCGTEKPVSVPNLNGGVSSCGCAKATRRGLSSSAEYAAWRNMVSRCCDRDAKDYGRYGAAGITVCAEWHDFLRFYADMGPRPRHGYTVERLNNALGYEPKNCRWATDFEQRRNKRCNVFIEAFGKRQIAADWARETGIHKNTILGRIRRGIAPEKALSGEGL